MGALCDEMENLCDSTRGETRQGCISCHSEGLTTASLAVSEQAHVESIKTALHQHARVFEHGLLLAIVAKYLIESEVLGASVAQNGEVLVRSEGHYLLAPLLELVLGHWAASRVHADGSFHVLDSVLVLLSEQSLFL